MLGQSLFDLIVLIHIIAKVGGLFRALAIRQLQFFHFIACRIIAVFYHVAVSKADALGFVEAGVYYIEYLLVCVFRQVDVRIIDIIIGAGIEILKVACTVVRYPIIVHVLQAVAGPAVS